MFEEIKTLENARQIEIITLGWSRDTKYYVELADNKTAILRLASIEQYEKKKIEYETIDKFAKTGIVMSQPMEFGVCNNGANVYMLLSWIEGTPLEEALPTMSDSVQYELGKKAGEILKKIHRIPVPPMYKPIQSKIPKKLKQLEDYCQSNIRIPGDETVITFIKEHINDVWAVPPVYQHGDYHPGNLIFTGNGEIGVIDFNRWAIGDPYEEFYKLEIFGTEISIPYCIGQIHGYFQGNVPIGFWRALSVYVAHASLYSIKWAMAYGEEDVKGMIRRCYRSFEHYDGFDAIVPNWYKD